MGIGKVNDNSGKKYTMEDLNITEGSPAASIFNRIDQSDGNIDGYLTENQYEEYMAEIEKFKFNKSPKEIKEQTKSKDKNHCKSLVKFGLGFVAFTSYVIRHGKLLSSNNISNNNHTEKQSDPKLVELDKKIKEEFGEK